MQNVYIVTRSMGRHSQHIAVVVVAASIIRDIDISHVHLNDKMHNSCLHISHNTQAGEKSGRKEPGNERRQGE